MKKKPPKEKNHPKKKKLNPVASLILSCGWFCFPLLQKEILENLEVFSRLGQEVFVLGDGVGQRGRAGGNSLHGTGTGKVRGGCRCDPAQVDALQGCSRSCGDLWDSLTLGCLPFSLEN